MWVARSDAVRSQKFAKRITSPAELPLTYLTVSQTAWVLLQVGATLSSLVSGSAFRS